MIEILLVKENTSDCIELINQINSLNYKSRLYQIVKNKIAIQNIILAHSIDIIIIDYNIFKEFTIIEFMKIIEKIKFIIILDNTITTTETYDNKYLFSNDNDLLLNLTNIINNYNRNMISSEEFLIKSRIRNELKYLGYNMSYCGSLYLVDVIYYMYTKYNSFDKNYIKNIYPTLAEKYHKTPNNIKCNITRATSIMFCECEEKKVVNYLGTCDFPKTGSKIIIRTILNKLK